MKYANYKDRGYDIEFETFNDHIRYHLGGSYEVLSEFKSYRSPITIKHECGNVYTIGSVNHVLRGGGKCLDCMRRSIRLKERNTEWFRNKVKEYYGDRFVVLGEYQGSHIPIKMLKVSNGMEYYVKPFRFYRNIIKTERGFKRTHENFCKGVIDMTDGEYCVVGQYKDTNTKVDIKHNSCGNVYSVKPKSFITGKRCPVCSSCKKSKGVKILNDMLQKSNMPYKTEQTLSGCKSKGLLLFDFLVFDGDKVKFAIEYDGIQHYKYVPMFHRGGFVDLLKCRIRDNIKTRYCKEHDIPLLRISYKQNIVDEFNFFIKNQFCNRLEVDTDEDIFLRKICKYK